MGVATLTGNDARQLPSRDERFAAANDNLVNKIRGKNSNSDIAAPVNEDPTSVKSGAIATGNNDSVTPPATDEVVVTSVETPATDEEVPTGDSITPANTDEVVTTKADIAALLQKQADATRAETEAKYEAKLAEARAEADAVKSRKQNLEDLFAIGNPKGNVHPVNKQEPNADITSRPFGSARNEAPENKFLFDTLGGQKLEVVGEGSPLLRRFDSLAKSLPMHRVNTSRGSAVQRDTRKLDAMVAADIGKNGKREIANGLEGLLRSKGLFQGGDSRVGSDAISTVADIPSVLFEYLSSFIRVNQFPDLIHYQFANNGVEIGVRPHKQIEVARHNYLPVPTSYAARQLTTGTRLNSSSQPVTEDNQLIEVLELGLGLASAGIDSAPIGFANFVAAFSMFNLETVIEENLGRDYQYTKDLALRGQLFRTDYVLYNKGGRAVTSPSFTLPTDKPSGTATVSFITSAVAKARELQIAPWRDGCYVYIHNPQSWQQYVSEKSTRERDMALSGVDTITRMMMRRTEDEAYGGQVSGFQGTYDGVHHFLQNVYGVGATSSSEGVQDTAFTGGTELTRTSFLIGRDTIAWVTALPAEIRFDEVTDFNRERRAVWYSHENAGSLDVKNTLNQAGTRYKEQLRVLECRTTDEVLT